MPEIGLLLSGQLTWNVPLFVALLCVVTVYIFAVRRYVEIGRGGFQILLFLLGIFLLYVVIGSPFAAISHLSFSLHMVQMSILYFIIPSLILLGIPEQLYMSMQKIPRKMWMNKIRFSPKAALYLFAILFLLYHLPFLLTILSKNPFSKNGYLFLLFILSFGMWLPMTSPNPKHRLHGEKMKRYALLSGYVLLPACLLFILTAFIDGGNNPFLSQLIAHLCIPNLSNSADILPPPFNTKYDQVLSGFFMLGLHKVGLVMVVKLEEQVQDSSSEKIADHVEKK